MAKDNIFMGMRASTDYTVENQRPTSIRGTIMYLYPNGSAPLTALTNMMSSESVDDPQYSWYTQMLPNQRATVTGLLTTAGAATTDPLTKGSRIRVQMTEKEASNFLKYHTVLLRNDDEINFDFVTIIAEDPVFNGDLSYITVKLLEDTTPGYNPSTASITTALIIGSAFPEGSEMPSSLTYDPSAWQNYTQIFKNSLEITNTARKTYLRSGDDYKRLKREKLELHSLEMEKAFLFGIPSEVRGIDGKPQRTTGGLIWAIKRAGIVDSFLNNPDLPADAPWLEYGIDYLNSVFERMFRYGSTERLCFAGSGAILALDKLYRHYGQWNWTTQTTSFGMKVVDWVTPFGTIKFKTHPLFSMESTNRHSMVLFEPKDLRYRYIRDTEFQEDKNKEGQNSKDGIHEQYLTEAGMEFHFPIKCAMLTNIGKDRPKGATTVPATPAFKGTHPVNSGNTTVPTLSERDWYDVTSIVPGNVYKVTMSAVGAGKLQKSSNGSIWTDVTLGAGDVFTASTASNITYKFTVISNASFTFSIADNT